MMKKKTSSLLLASALAILFWNIYDQVKKYSNRGKYLVGNLVLGGAKSIKSCSIMIHGKEIYLSENYISAIFDNYRWSTGTFDLGTNGFGNEFQVKINFEDGGKVETGILYERGQQVVTLEVYDGFFEDARFLSTKLSDPEQIKLAENYLRN